jgi:hypothetical protein
MFALPRFRGQLGVAADQRQAQLLVDLGVQVQAPLAAAIQQVQNVAKYEPGLYEPLRSELTKMLEASGNLEREINQIPLPVTEDTSRVVYKKVEMLALQAESLRRRVLDASRVGVEQKQLRTAVWSVSIGMLSVGLGWLLYRRAVKRMRRR